jgi:hypothetical protein
MNVVGTYLLLLIVFPRKNIKRNLWIMHQLENLVDNAAVGSISACYPNYFLETDIFTG